MDTLKTFETMHYDKSACVIFRDDTFLRTLVALTFAEMLRIFGGAMHQKIADATFRIECGQNSGSGFSFRDASVIVTNYHVVKPHHVTGQKVEAVTEAGTRVALQLLSHSPEDQYDFAILRTQSPIPGRRTVLQPSNISSVSRGFEVIFAGFPHGIHDLLVQEAIISGPVGSHGFYIDGSVNGGNSGGPIVEKASGEVVGIVTQRRFLGTAELKQLSQQITQLTQYFQNAAQYGSVAFLGMDFGTYGQMMAQSLLVINEVLKQNANTGIGIGFSIEHVNAECVRLAVP